MSKIELYNDHFENAKRYGIPHAQLIIADIPYNLGNNAYASNPSWYIDGDNKNGESKLAGKSFFDTDNDFRINNFFDFCTRYLKKEPKQGKGNVIRSMFYDIDADCYIMVDGDEYKMDLLMYHLKMHRYVVIELKAVEFIPEFVSKLNFYISAVDEYLKSPQDNPTIGLLLCPTKSNEKVRFSLRGFSQPMGVAEYEIKQLIEEVQSALPPIEDKE